MNSSITLLNAFIEDTCVLIVIAYLLARGRLLTLLFQAERNRQQDAALGLLLGLIGMMEVIFPGARYPYVIDTLIVTFGTLVGGARVGLTAATIITVGACFVRPFVLALDSAVALFASALISALVLRLFGARATLLRGLTAGTCAQAGVVLLHHIPITALHTTHLLARDLPRIPANGFGLLLLQLVLNDARTRAESEQNRLEAERAHALMSEARLAALRARIKPHFLYNAHTSIAALCAIAPEKAETAILRLSQLMRRALETQAAAPVCLSEELEYVRAYLEIEQHRMGSHLRTQWEIAPESGAALLPAFTVQTLVENAITHGVAPNWKPGTVQITARTRRRYVLIAVQDSGAGMTPETLRSALAPKDRYEHGLQIVTQQLTMLYGSRARLRLFSRPDGGTLVAFRVPAPEKPLIRKKRSYANRLDRG